MNIWDKPFLQSKIHSEEVSKTEMFLGYLIGPSLMFLMINALSGTYLMQFYTDVVGISGSLIVIMPIVSKILVAICNILFSNLINKTKTSQGKARPWLLLSGIILPLAGILLYMVPRASYQAQVTWILFSYNFFFVIALNIYSLSHYMMLPRSSRVSQERDKLTLFKNVAEAMIPGTLSAVIMPFIIRQIGVGPAAQKNWFSFMLILSILAVPAALIEYYFTKERVHEEKKSYSFTKQFKDSLKYKEWVIVILLIGLKMVESSFMTNTMLYYCNWVVGDSIQNGANYQALFNVIGQFPLGIGVFVMWPFIKKYGKYNVMQIGYLVAMIGCLIVFFNPQNFVLVLVGMFIRSIGSIPSMMSVSLMSDVIDKVEEKLGYRFDSLGASMNSILHNVSLGIAQTTILLSISLFGYISPESSMQVIHQPDSLRFFFNFCMAGIPFLCFLVSYILITILNKKLKNVEHNV